MAQPASSRADTTTVVVIDDPTLFAESLATALLLDGYDVHRVAPGPPEVTVGRAIPEGSRPTIAVLDLDIGAEHDAMEILSVLTADDILVAVVTASDDQSRWGECLAHGASRVLSKTIPLAEVLDVVRRLEHGLPVMSPDERAALLREHRDRVRAELDTRLRFMSLTPDESWVLDRMMAGLHVDDIAAAADSSPAAVHAEVSSILEKLQVTSRLSAVAIASEIGWRPTPRTWNSDEPGAR
jgi:two-component system nitrate/nitrite response regulator NarL